MIRGFSKWTGFDCFQCQHKCCATEYELPLLPTEAQYLRRVYPVSSWFMKQTKSREFLIRGDSCIFLTTQGLCTLHNTQTKPLTCEIFPLIFWKISSDEYLSWIHPCGRGSGFQWVIDPDKRLPDNLIEDSYQQTRTHFTSFWGEQIDQKNPFGEISIERVQQEQKFFRNIDENELSESLVKFGENKFPSEPFSTLISVYHQNPDRNDLIQTETAVLHWLSWSPTGLQLTFLNAKLIFLTAALWIYIVGLTQNITESKEFESSPGWLSEYPELAILFKETSFPAHSYYTFPQSHINNHLGSLLATAILPSFWNQVASHSPDHRLHSFALAVKSVLEGQTPQQELSQFFRG